MEKPKTAKNQDLAYVTNEVKILRSGAKLLESLGTAGKERRAA